MRFFLGDRFTDGALPAHRVTSPNSGFGHRPSEPAVPGSPVSASRPASLPSLFAWMLRRFDFPALSFVDGPLTVVVPECGAACPGQPFVVWEARRVWTPVLFRKAAVWWCLELPWSFCVCVQSL